MHEAGGDHDDDEHDRGSDGAGELDRLYGAVFDAEEHHAAGDEADGSEEELQVYQRRLPGKAQASDGAVPPLAHLSPGHHGPVRKQRQVQDDAIDDIHDDGNETAQHRHRSSE